MLVKTPDPARYAAAVLMGRSDTASGVLGMGVVLKAAYDLVADGSNPRRMEPVADPARAAVVMADIGVTRFTAADGVPPIFGRIVEPSEFSILKGRTETEPDVPVLTVDGRVFALSGIVAADDPGLAQVLRDDMEPPEVTDTRHIDFDLTYEADTALVKDRADIVVTGFGAQEGTVGVNGATWLTRNPALPAVRDADFARNLFGFQPRLGAPREGQAGDSSAFASFHRRGGFFGDAGTGIALPSGGLVEIFRSLDTSGDPDYALVLPDLDRAMRLRVYCGHGPDKPPHWRKVSLGLMRPDTLFVHPAANRAEILWRRRWDADIEPQDRYRSVQIAEGGF